MKLLRTGFLICLIASLLIACGPSQPKLQPLADNAVVVAFGDSLTYGKGVSRDKSYPAVLAQLIQRTVINAGVNGETSGHGLSRLPEVLAQYHPQLVILGFGGNDILRRVDPQQTTSNITSMIKDIRATGAQVILLAPPTRTLTLSAPKFYRALAKQYQVPLDDESLPELLGDNQYKSDWIHLNAKGYAQLAHNLAKLMAQTGAIR